MNAYRVPLVAIGICLLLGGCRNPSQPHDANLLLNQYGSEQEGLLEVQNEDGFVEITVPVPTGLNPALVPPISTFLWQTLPGSEDPDHVRRIIVSAGDLSGYNDALDYIRNNPDAPEWSDWQPYDPSSGTGTSWTTPPIDYGPHVFAVHGKKGDVVADEFDFQRNARRILVSSRSTGPILRVTSDFFDPTMTSTTQTPLTTIDLPAGTDLIFCWTADASIYGGVVAGYRYGWDLIDPDDDNEWPMPFTPFDEPEECSPVRTFIAGTHMFHIEVIDNNGYKSRVPIRINIYGPVLGLFDIQPSSCRNPFNPKSNRMMKTAILGTQDFDVRDIDISTVSLEGVEPVRDKIKDTAAPDVVVGECACSIKGPDGYDDLVLSFRTDELVEALELGDYRHSGGKSRDEFARPVLGQLDPGDVLTLTITASLTDGGTFESSDCVVIVGHQDDGVCREAQWLFDGSGVDETGRHDAAVAGGAGFVLTPEDQGLFTQSPTDFAQYNPGIDQLDAGQIICRFKLEENFPPSFGTPGSIVVLASDRPGSVNGDFSLHLAAIDGRLWFMQENAAPMWMLRSTKDMWEAGVWYDVVVSWSPAGRKVEVTWDAGSEMVSDGAAMPCFSADAGVRTIGARDDDAPLNGLTIERLEIRCEGKTPKMPVPFNHGTR